MFELSFWDCNFSCV